MLTFLAPVISSAGFALYFVFPTRMGVYRRYPWGFLGIVAAGALLGAYRLYDAPGVGTLLAALLSAGILVLACWYIFSYSMFGVREERPRVGDRFPQFSLPASHGPAFSLAEARGHPLLILFYRGAW